MNAEKLKVAFWILLVCLGVFTCGYHHRKDMERYHKLPEFITLREYNNGLACLKILRKHTSGFVKAEEGITAMNNLHMYKVYSYDCRKTGG